MTRDRSPALSLAPPSSRNPARWLLAVLTLLGLTVSLVDYLRPAHADEPPAKTSKPRTDKKGQPPMPAEKTDAPEGGAENPFPQRFPAPSLDGGKEWLNVGGPISMKDLRGKVVLLDFWTYCCINCMHVLPDLAFLEKKYEKELVVIGVHSAKFDNEKESENIRRAILRYEIEHPVINDHEMTVWRKFGVRAWPTLVVIDPEGQYCGYVSGEGNRELLVEVVDKLIAFHRAKGTLDPTPVKFALEKEKEAATPLRFPGKVLADEKNNRLFISDSNHNRILVTDLAGKLLHTIGTGAIGRTNGAFEEATFDHPQGMALLDQTLYVADTENHLIREIDLQARRVRTLAGTGKQGSHRTQGGMFQQTDLGSPWDLQAVGKKLYAAMAGPHQIWVADLESRVIKPFAGSGREDILNGPLAEAALAQPSGITTDGKFLYVVDSEGSAVRQISLEPKGAEVTTVVGTSDLPQGRCLFEFGDRDGKGDEVRLQHPLGIVHHKGQLYIADSYNHKIKRVDPKTKTATTFAGDGTPGDRDDPPRFSEPAGLAVAAGKLYVADTNNHRIRTIDLQTLAVATVEIPGLAPPAIPKSTGSELAGEVVAVDPQTVVPGEELLIHVRITLPDEYKFNPGAPLTWKLTAPNEQTLVTAEQLNAREEAEAPAEGEPVSIRVPVKPDGAGTIQLNVTWQYCRAGTGGLCKLGTATWSIPVQRAETGAKSIPLDAKAE